MKHLPVPDLSDTLSRYLTAVEPLLEPGELEGARCAVAEFATGVGPRCQAELERFADEERGAGRSWLSEAWLDGYLSVRAPLPLSTSVGFRLAWPTSTAGLALAAEVVHGFACVHLAFLRGEGEPEVTPRGEPVDSGQWQVVTGGLRHPRPGADEIRTGLGRGGQPSDRGAVAGALARRPDQRSHRRRTAALRGVGRTGPDRRAPARRA